MEIYLVGSSIHGDLLSPNDKDIAVECKSEQELKNVVLLLGGNIYHGTKEKGMAIIKNGTLNNIIFYGFTVKEYVKSMDINIVRGYRNLKNNSLTLFPEAKQALKTKTLEFLPRKALHEIFEVYGDKQSERLVKYVDKLPEGWTLKLTKRKSK